MSPILTTMYRHSRRSRPRHSDPGSGKTSALRLVHLAANLGNGIIQQTPSYQSLRNSRDFRRVLSDGKRRRKGGIVMVSSPGQAGPPRLGLLVSKNCGPAVTRNRIKRRLRSAADSVELKPGIDYVIIATNQVAEAPYEQLKDWLGRAVEDSTRV